MTEVLNPGWDIEGGFHVSFFNHDESAAWTVDLSLSNEFNTASSNHAFRVHNVLAGVSGEVLIPQIDVVIKNMDRTSFNYGVGREWYFWDCATDDSHTNWRWGFDIGGRWGTTKMNFENFPHRTEAFTGVYTDFHVDYMFPWRCYIWFAGLRVEWDYDFIHHILQNSDTEITEFNFILEAGMRY